MAIYRAEHGEILRGSRKDDEFLLTFRSQFSELIKSLLGDALWIRFYKHLQPTTDFLYHSATTLSGVQTLGEEYLGLIQVSKRSGPELPAWWQSLAWTATESFGPQLVDQKLEQLKRRDEKYYRKKTVADRTPIGRIVASALLRQLSFATLRNVHWAIFFLSTGTFYSLWKRAVGIKYVTIRPQTNTKIAILFKIIGVTVLLQYVLKFVLAVRYDVLKSMRRHAADAKPRPPAIDTEGEFFCDICLNREDPVSTPCGHLYCYGCILFHSEHSGLEPDLGQCPQCRFQFELRCLIPILNL